MSSSISFEVLDLRHFTSALLIPLLEAETNVWRDRLNWDYRTSTRLLMQYLDNRMLPGYAAVDGGRVTGYAFCVYEESKAVIGDVFGLPGSAARLAIGPGAAQTPHEVEETLLRHLFETLQNSPNVNRIESQLLLHASGTHSGAFHEAGFLLYRRLFMVRPLNASAIAVRNALPPDLELRAWRDDDLNAASRLISEAYADHPDSLINDQYRSAHGSLRFLHNIVRYSGCGVFSPVVSHVVIERSSRDLVALVLGSRVSTESGHITQLCVLPRQRGRGLGRLLLSVAAMTFFRQGMSEVSLTVTEANSRATGLYISDGYETRHTFDAAVWER